MDTEVRKLDFKLAYILIGVCVAAAMTMIPLKYALLLIAGAGFAVFTFFKLEISFGLFLSVTACAPHEYWNNMLIVLGAVFYAGVYAVQYFSGKRKGLDLKYLAPSLMVYVFFCIVSLFIGFGGMDSVRVFAILFGCIVISVLFINIISTKAYFDMAVKMITIAITLSALLGIYRYMSGIEIKSEFVDLTKSQGLSRLYSVMANPNNDAEFWVMLLPFSIASAFITKCDVKRLFIGGMVVVCLAALMLTYSRAGYIALMGAAGIFILLTAPRLVPVCILLFMMLIPFIPTSIVDRLLTVGKDTSSKYRFLIWEGSINMVKDYWVQGIGMGPTAFSTIYRGYANRSALNAMHAHNVPLNVWVETGIGGFMALLAYFIKTLKMGVSAFYQGEDKMIRFYSAAAVSSFVAFFIFSMVEYVWYYPRVMLCFWIISAMAFSLHKISGGKRA